MRIGYAVSNPDLIGCLNNVKYSFNSYTMNQPDLVCGAAAVQDEEYFREKIRMIVETREWAKGKLKELGFVFPEPKANFIFAKHPDYDAGMLFRNLKEHNIYVRHWDSERIRDYLRITIGTKEEMEALFDFLKGII